jgi:HSP20 family protein
MLARQFARLPDFTLMPEPMLQMDRLMDTLFSGAESAGVAPVHPAMNVFEDEHSITIEAELPGFTMDNLDISVLGQELTISGKRQWTAPEGCTVHRRERTSSTNFSRSVRIGTPIDAAKVSAKLDAGVLTVTLPKAESAKPRKIEIKTA